MRNILPVLLLICVMLSVLICGCSQKAEEAEPDEERAGS